MTSTLGRAVRLVRCRVDEIGGGWVAASQHRRESDVVRDAVAAYLDAQPA